MPMRYALRLHLLQAASSAAISAAAVEAKRASLSSMYASDAKVATVTATRAPSKQVAVATAERGIGGHILNPPDYGATAGAVAMRAGTPPPPPPPPLPPPGTADAAAAVAAEFATGSNESREATPNRMQQIMGRVGDILGLLVRWRWRCSDGLLQYTGHREDA